jgi:hypothetical protein
VSGSLEGRARCIYEAFERGELGPGGMTDEPADELWK